MCKTLKYFFAKTGKIMLIFAVAGWVLGFFVVQGAWSATYYMPDNFANLQAAMSGMSGGDTLIIRDGTYTGLANTITRTAEPPNGNAEQYTIIRAEHDGKVLFDGQDTRDVFYLDSASFIEFRGLVWGNNNFVGADVSLVMLVNSNHIKFIRCGAFNVHDGGDGHVFASYDSTDLLYEECYAWGSGDYTFNPARGTDRAIYRRCVVRQDRQIGWDQTYAFFAYGSRNIEFQNCIIIDSNNDSSFYDAVPNAWAFRYAEQGYDLTSINFRGCIAINNTSGGVAVGSGTTANTSVLFDNCLSIGSVKGSRFRYNGANLDHCTFFDILSVNTDTWGRGIYFEGQGDNTRESITNSIIAYIPNNIGILGGISSYNSLYGNGTNYSGTSYNNDITNIDQKSDSVLYPIRIEPESDLSGIASDSGDIGATVLKKIGVDGTLWGEEGYATITDIDLWPFPHEDVIKQNMAAYSDYNINGARGFCAQGKQLNGDDTVTLTSYIWEYLGNQMPVDIYGLKRGRMGSSGSVSMH